MGKGNKIFVITIISVLFFNEFNAKFMQLKFYPSLKSVFSALSEEENPMKIFHNILISRKHKIRPQTAPFS